MEQEIDELCQQLHSSEREIKIVRQELQENLKGYKDNKEKKQDQQIKEVMELVQAKDRDLAKAHETITEMTKQEAAKNRELDEALQRMQEMKQQVTELEETKNWDIILLRKEVEDLKSENGLIREQLSGVKETIYKQEQELRERKYEFWQRYNSCGTPMRTSNSQPDFSVQHSPTHSLKMPSLLYDQPGLKRSFSFFCKKQLKIECQELGNVTYKLTRGSATTDYQFMYFTSWNTTLVYRYKWDAKTWETLASCPFSNSALVIIACALTAVGGVYEDNKPTKELRTLEHKEWKNVHPSMKTARSCPAVVRDRDYVVVIAGDVGGNNQMTKVELLQVRSKTWFEVADLPQPVKFPSATILGSWVHVVSNDGCGFSCSLQDLSPSSEPIKPESLSWTVLPQLPVAKGTAATFKGALVVVGGQQKEGEKSSVSSIYQLMKGGEWKEIGTMSCVRFNCLVVAPTPSKLMIVGGFGRGVMDTPHVIEECF